MADGAAGCPRRSELYARARGVLGYDLAAACRSEDSVHHTAVSQPAMYVAGLAAAYGEVRGAEIHERDAGDERIAGASEHRSGTGEPGEPGGILSSPGSAGRSETSGVAGDLAASAFSVAAAQVDVACGLSLGEYTALAFAGSVSFEAGLRLVRARGEAMQAASELEPSGMVSVTGLGRGECEALCAAACTAAGLPIGAGDLVVANVLGPQQFVLSGAEEACSHLERLAPLAGARSAKKLRVSGAFHSKFMAPAAPALAAALAEADFAPPRVPVLGNVDAAPHSTDPDPEVRGALIRGRLLAQLTSPVLWADILDQIVVPKEFERAVVYGPGRQVNRVCARD
jgi:malonyl CoA-acyl carrier protein transacylase